MQLPLPTPRPLSEARGSFLSPEFQRKLRNGVMVSPWGSQSMVQSFARNVRTGLGGAEGAVKSENIRVGGEVTFT